jgi:hypothetical protein
MLMQKWVCRDFHTSHLSLCRVIGGASSQIDASAWVFSLARNTFVPTIASKNVSLPFQLGSLDTFAQRLFFL